MATREELIASLDQAISLLRSQGRTHWVKWLERDRGFIAAGDFFGIEGLLSAFGGMGSLMDEGMLPTSPGSNILDTNNPLSEALSRVHGIASELKREQDRREAI